HTFLFSSRRRHTSFSRDWSSDVCSSDLLVFALSWVVSSSDAILTALSEQVGELFPAFDDALLREIATLARQRVWGMVSFVFLLRSEERRVGNECRCGGWLWSGKRGRRGV